MVKPKALTALLWKALMNMAGWVTRCSIIPSTKLLMKQPKLLFFFAAILLVVTAKAQTPDTAFIARAAKALHNAGGKYAVEKVYLQLDKPYYMTGDDIWFKAYVTSGGRHLLSQMSGVLYVEL